VVALTIVQALVLWLLVSGDPQRVHWAAIATLPLLAGALADVYGKAILQGQGRYTAFNILRNGAVAFYLVGVLGLLAAGETGVLQFAIAWVAASMLAGVLTASVALRHRPRPVSPEARVSAGSSFASGSGDTSSPCRRSRPFVWTRP
jgi:hypothetical protein